MYTPDLAPVAHSLLWSSLAVANTSGGVVGKMISPQNTVLSWMVP